MSIAQSYLPTIESAGGEKVRLKERVDKRDDTDGLKRFCLYAGSVHRHMTGPW